MVPVLPNDHPFAELFAAVAANQEDLREIDKERNEALNTASHQKTLVQDSEEYHRTLIENSIDAISIIDINGNIISISKSAEKISGYTNEERKKENAFTLMLPDDRKKLMLLFEEIKENYGSVTQMEFKIYHKDGSIRNIEGTAKNMLHSPIVKGIIFNYRDVTERFKQQNLLKHSEEYYRTLIENSIDAIVIIDINRNIIFYSKSAENIFGYTSEERKSKSISAFTLMLPDDRKKMISVFKEITENKENYGEVVHIEFRGYHKDGSIRHIEGTVKNMLHSPAVKGIVLNYRDVTHKKVIEKEKKQRETYLTELIKINDISFKADSTTELQNFVEIIGKVANASRTYLFKNHKNKNNELLLSQLAEYVAEGIKPEINNPELQNIKYKEWIPRWEETLKKGEMISGRVADFPAKERMLLEPQEIISLIVIPIFADNTFWGFLGFDNCVNNKEWNDNDIKYFTIATKRLEHSIELVKKQKLLSAENKRFKITMDAMNSGIYVADMQSYELLFMNKFFIDLFGDKTGEKCYKVLQGLDEPCSFCNNKNLLDDKGKPKKLHIWEFQNRITKCWYQHRDQAIRWADGRMVRMQVAVDITKQIESDKQIRIHSQFVKTTSQSVIITDIEGNTIFVNEALIKTAGFHNKNEITGQSIYTFTDELGAKKLKEEILPSIYENGFYNGELNFKKKNNSFYPGEITGSFIPNEAGKPEFFVAMFNDISERKQAEKEIKAKQKLNELLLNSMPYPIMLINRKRKVKAANKIALDTGVKIGDYCWKVFGKCENLSEENLMHAKNNPDKPGIQCAFCMMDEMFKTHKTINNPSIDAFGKIWDTYWIPLNDDEYLHYAIDITERKQAEKELIAAKEKAEESNRLKTAFLNNMSHEIRTPLNGITGFLELLNEPDLEAEYKQEYIDIINKSSHRLISTVTDIIEVSKIEAGLVEVSIETVSVNEILHELHSFFSLEAKNKGLILMQLPSLSDEEASVLTDNDKLNAILTILIKNAIKFTEKGSVAFGYKHETDSLKFFVMDTGIGIPKDRQQAIFNHFEQADIEDKRAFEGSGLGLAIAKSYVETLGGKIWLKTKEDSGTEFMFTIPYKTKNNIVKKENQQNKPENKQGNLKALSVLIAEDEKPNIQLFEAVFRDTFKQIIFVETGQDAIDVCKENPEIDLVLMDIKMPVMNGYMATRKIRKFNKDIIIIAQTAFGLEGDKEKSLEAGCNDYISKPINKKELFEKIKLHSLKE
ncbi:MAG: hypothetical protein B7C24_00345 [Bacteroidetes bacterium 4572_77]|nr:MAG: hypothetical protein B7C24_00345 [Bacteroidetes bacterium 4572_77]